MLCANASTAPRVELVHISSIALEKLIETLRSACFLPSNDKKQEQLSLLEEQVMHADCLAYGLMHAVSVYHAGSELEYDCRMLAVTLLKRLVVKRWMPMPRGRSDPGATVVPLNIVEKHHVKQFLCSYWMEPHCMVAVQLASITALVVKYELPIEEKWPDLLPALCAAISSWGISVSVLSNLQPNADSIEPYSVTTEYLCSLRGLVCLEEILRTLGSSTSCGLQREPFCRLCASLFGSVLKLWAKNFKELQEFLKEFDLKAPLTSYAAHRPQFEAVVVHMIVCTKVLALIINHGLELICDNQMGSDNQHRQQQSSATIDCFWKSMIRSILLVSRFIRDCRPLYAVLMMIPLSADAALTSVTPRIVAEAVQKFQSMPQGIAVKSGVICDAAIYGQSSVLMKRIILSEDDEDEVSDYFIPQSCFSGQNYGIFSIINLMLKLLKELVAIPVAAQYKHPLLVVPILQSVLGFFYKHLMDEFPQRVQQEELKGSESAVGDRSFMTASATGQFATGSAMVARTEQMILPLKFVTLAAVAMMSNILRCRAYYSEDCDGPMAIGGADAYAQCSARGTAYDNQKSSALQCGDQSRNDLHRLHLASTADSLRTSFFNAERTFNLVTVLLYPLLPFYSSKELQDWSECPEDFFLSQSAIRCTPSGNSVSQSQNYCIKVACELLFCELLKLRSNDVCSIIVPLLLDLPRQMHAATPNAVSREELLLWESVYLCAGLGVATIAPFISLFSANVGKFPQAREFSYTLTGDPCSSVGNNEDICGDGASYWLVNYLGPLLSYMLSAPDAGVLQPDKQQLLRSRLIIVVNLWMHRFESTILPQVLSVLVSVIAPTSDSDIVVQLNAVHAIERLISLPAFDTKIMVMAAAPTVNSMCQLMMRLEESEHRVMVLSLVAELVRLLHTQQHEQLSAMVVQISGVLHQLWVGTDPVDPTKCSLLEVFAELVNAAGESSIMMHDILLPIILQSCQSAGYNCTSEYFVSTKTAASPAKKCAIRRGLASLTFRHKVRAPTSKQSMDCFALSDSSTTGVESGDAIVDERRRSSNGLLVSDGVLLWSAVMRQLPQHHCTNTLLHLAYEGMTTVFCSTPAQQMRPLLPVAGGKDQAQLLPKHIVLGVTCSGDMESEHPHLRGVWNLAMESDGGALLVKNLMLILECYALHAGDILLMNDGFAALLKEIYEKLIGSVHESLVSYLMRPLMALLVQNAEVAGEFMIQSGVLQRIMMITSASGPCPVSASVFAAYSEGQVSQIAYLSLYARIMLLHPVALFKAIISFRSELFKHLCCLEGESKAQSSNLCDGIILCNIAGSLAAAFADVQNYSNTPIVTRKEWCLALLSLYPPSIDCATNFVSARDPLETLDMALTQQHLHSSCIFMETAEAIKKLFDRNTTNAGAQQPTSELQKERRISCTCIWSGMITSEQLFEWVPTLVSIWRIALVDERRKKAKLRFQRQVDALVEGLVEEHNVMVLNASTFPLDALTSDEEGVESEEDDEPGHEGFLFAGGVDEEYGTVTKENIVRLHRELFCRKTGIPQASLELWISEKLNRLRMYVGEARFAELSSCIGMLDL